MVFDCFFRTAAYHTHRTWVVVVADSSYYARVVCYYYYCYVANMAWALAFAFALAFA